MRWGWMPRPFVAQLAQYTALASRQLFDGGFRVADAVDASTWASYVVGTAQGGAYHYALRLSSNASATDTTPPVPAAQAWGISVSGGTSPQMQEPVVVTVGGVQYALFVVNTSSGSTTTSALYEVNVATGQAAGGGALSGGVLVLLGLEAVLVLAGAPVARDRHGLGDDRRSEGSGSRSAGL